MTDIKTNKTAKYALILIMAGFLTRLFFEASTLLFSVLGLLNSPKISVGIVEMQEKGTLPQDFITSVLITQSVDAFLYSFIWASALWLVFSIYRNSDLIKFNSDIVRNIGIAYISIGLFSIINIYGLDGSKFLQFIPNNKETAELNLNLTNLIIPFLNGLILICVSYIIKRFKHIKQENDYTI